MNSIILALGEPFKNIQRVEIDPTTFSWCGSITDYDWKDPKSSNSIGFIPVDIENIDLIAQLLIQALDYSEEYKEGIVKVYKERKDYETDKRPRIVIKLDPGMRGLRNPPSFSFEAVSTETMIDASDMWRAEEVLRKLRKFPPTKKITIGGNRLETVTRMVHEHIRHYTELGKTQ